MYIKTINLIAITALILYVSTFGFAFPNKNNLIVLAAQTNKPVFTGQLAPDFSNWSWNSQITFKDTINFTPYPWGGLYLHTNNSLDTSQYTALQLSLQYTQTIQNFKLIFYDNNNQSLPTTLLLNKYTSNPSPNTWNTYTFPFSDIPGISTGIKGFAIQNDTSQVQPTLYLTNIQFIAANQLSPSLTLAPASTPTSNPFAGITLFNPEKNPASWQRQQWQSSRPSDAVIIDKIASQPKAIWMGNWNADIQKETRTIADKANQINTLPVFVSYNIPNRDCGSYSTGGSSSYQTYQNWINNFASGIGIKRAVVILEPDALSQSSCLQSDLQQQRFDLLRYAVQKFKSSPNTAVYLDAGHSGWINPAETSQRLIKAGIGLADGFALNTSSFQTTTDSINYGQQISNQTGGKHFIIDTSRNGNGPAANNAWCNPEGRALGNKPTTQTGNPLVDAYLWIKYPGESDGYCNNAPAPGVWMPEYALGLAQRANW